MNNNLRYPQILEAGQLRILNDEIISLLGVPVFFVTPEPSRPHSEDACGRLYEIITGLYIVYHDYGTTLLSRYLHFCKINLQMYGNFAYKHYESINILRGGFCHGCMPRGKHVQDMMKQLNFYFPEANPQWPLFLSSMSEQQCIYMVDKITDFSNKMVSNLKICAQKISDNPQLFTKWKEEFFASVINKNQPKYNGNTTYFDKRIVEDIVKTWQRSGQKYPYNSVLCQWVKEMEEIIQADGIKHSDQMSNALYDALFDLYHPKMQATRKSSADTLLADFDF